MYVVSRGVVGWRGSMGPGWMTAGLRLERGINKAWPRCVDFSGSRSNERRRKIAISQRREGGGFPS